jgi:hypothetical protein
MKNRSLNIVFSLAALLLAITFSSAQSPVVKTVNDSTYISEYLRIHHTDDTKWLRRYQKDIDRYIDINRTLTDFSCDLLIFGSSSINMWTNIYNDLSPLKIIRRSYGGATIRDMLYNYDVIARGYNPKKIAIYVENDIGGDRDLTVGDTYDMFRVFTARIQRDYPGIPFYIISLKPSPLKAYHLKKQLMINSLITDFAKRTHNVFYIDITKDMYDNDGKVRKDIFLKDSLHMNQTGYDIWTKIIKKSFNM